MKLFTTTLALFLLISVLAACGESQEPQAPDAPQTAVESDTTAEAPPTTEPTAPPPTAESQPTDPPAPAEPPSETAESAPRAVASGIWGESNSGAQSACDNPYFPLRTGYRYTLRDDTGQEMTWEVLAVSGDMRSASAEMQMTFDDFTFSYIWECSQEGGLTSFEFAGQGLAGLSPDMEMALIEGSGAFIPPAADIAPGYTWESTFLNAVSFSQTEGDLELDVTGEIDTQQHNMVMNTESVDYEGQSVPGFLMQQDTDMQMAMTALGNTIDSQMSFAGETQFAYGIGILRQTAFTDFGDFTSELVDYYVP